ncbi:hypothetical protein CesoFtcFv8_004993 [Champsocephalus esox]|uniref:Secreted protein n=1 Tax=Champsocephalus esox TaxID=159716 RepID=A0AAN8CR43_9TELE|nr:hypothetical protein CesoFtcFv8_004993 [Champsocephalus esox]
MSLLWLRPALRMCVTEVPFWLQPVLRMCVPVVPSLLQSALRLRVPLVPLKPYRHCACVWWWLHGPVNNPSFERCRSCS